MAMKTCLWGAAAAKIKRHIDMDYGPDAVKVNILFCLK